MPARYRKRAAVRRENWSEIGEAARGTLERKLKRPPGPAPHRTPLREAEAV